MPDCKDLHCPFLNRSDRRCSEMFNLDHLQHAFKFCVDQYSACPMYAQMLAERQGRRAFVAARRSMTEQPMTAAAAQQGNYRDAGRRNNPPLVQVTIGSAFTARQPAAA